MCALADLVVENQGEDFLDVVRVGGVHPCEILDVGVYGTGHVVVGYGVVVDEFDEPVE